MTWILGEGPLSLSTLDSFGYSNGYDRELIEWDDSHAVIVYSDYDPVTDSYGDHVFVSTLVVDQETGEVTKINESKFDTIVPGDEENEIPDTMGDGDYWSPHTTVRVGDLIAHWRWQTGMLYTFAVDSSTGAWVQAAAPIADPFGYDMPNHRKSGRIVPWGPSTMLLVAEVPGPTEPFGGYYEGGARFASWDGSTWDFSPVAKWDNANFGGADYMNIAGILDNGQQRAIVTESLRHDPVTGAFIEPMRHVIIAGSYPSAPTFTVGSTPVGLQGFYNREMFATDDQSGIMRAVPMHEGTTDFLTDGSDGPFDWGLVEVTLDDGVISQAAPVTIGTTDEGWYDIAMVQDAFGNPVAIWPIPGFEYGSVYGTPSALRARNLATDETVLIDRTGWEPSPPDRAPGDGLQQNDYSWRNLARVGSWYLTAYRSLWSALIEVQSFGVPFVVPEVPYPAITGVPEGSRRGFT